jgi:hypothetical protein
MKNFIALFCLLLCQVVFSQIDYAQFEGKKGKISFFKEYSLSNIYDYNLDAENKDSLIVRLLNGNHPEALISKKYSSEFLKNINDSIVFSIKLKTRLIIEIQNKEHSLISYKTSKNEMVSVIDYVNDNGWLENTDNNKELDLMKSILKNSNSNIIFEFYNRKNNKNYPEINTLKPLVKNENGILDIEKLAQVIKENKSTLSKYIDQ